MIKLEMDMPKSCVDCEFYILSMYEETCDITKYSLDMVSQHERHPNCPLIECEEEE